MPEAVHANAMLQVKADKNKTAMMQLQSAHLAASSSCLSGGLQEAHLSALRQYAALLVNKSQDSYDPYTYDPYKPQTAYTPGVDGSNAEGTPAGFLAVTSLCCPLQTEMWFLRLLDYLDYQPCYQDQTIGTYPHIQGLMHWFTCVPAMDFSFVMDTIEQGNPCKYWTKKGTVCPPLNPTCEEAWCR